MHQLHGPSPVGHVRAALQQVRGAASAAQLLRGRVGLGGLPCTGCTAQGMEVDGGQLFAYMYTAVPACLPAAVSAVID